MKVKVLAGQSLLDISIQEYGDLSGVFLLAIQNDISPTDDLRGGQELERPDVTVDREMERYCRDNGIRPATARTETAAAEEGIFTETFTLQFM